MGKTEDGKEENVRAGISTSINKEVPSLRKDPQTLSQPFLGFLQTAQGAPLKPNSAS